MDLMEAIPCIPFHEEDWVLASDLDLSLRKKGITVPPMDVLIAQVCLRHNVPLFTLDNHFNSFEDIRLLETDS
jgi:predicted nucleic acid-binding protein